MQVINVHKRLNSYIDEYTDRCPGVVYQLCNRFAWSWKIASLGVPVVLIYLGFLNAREMLDQGEPFINHAAWKARLRSHAKSIVPEEAWGKRFQINGVPAWFLIKSMELPVDVKKPICP